jgi:hypothetical protein
MEMENPMKIATLTGLVLMLLFTAADAEMHGDRKHPHIGSEEAFELILSYADETTAADLTALRAQIDATRDELKALHGADEVDEDAVRALREELRTLRKGLFEQVRAIVDANEELRADLRALARDTRQHMIAGGYALRTDEGFNELIAAASAEQAAALTDSQGQIDAIKAEIKAARDAGATREDLKDLASQLRALREEQRDIVAAVLEANAELRASLLEQARAARQEMRDEMRDKRPRRKRPNG